MVTLTEMVKAGMHFGHQSRRWNPRMAPYIYGERNGVHIIDLIQTYKHLQEVCAFVKDQSKKKKTFLFVGTKNQAEEIIVEKATEAGAFYVNHRWLGGMLTNWKTMKTSIDKLKQLHEDEANGVFERLPKKEAAFKRKQKEKLERYLGGLKEMTQVPDIVILVGQTEEMNAVLECRKLGLRSITILDTDCDPQLADFFIPANDDSVSSIQLILNELTSAILLGREESQQTREVVS
uniref:Small ribosomal subunit protein uS2c n=1 Tax=Marsupiomonas sp. NIES 1824 TaxID=1562198 RepID=A0A097KLZ6_9CHLO|nr:ribosomal protein S2 [Marsupiomonas sp. NIES 1824]